MSVLFVFRIFILAAGVDRIWGDEQANMDCSSRGGSPGWVPSHESSWHSKQPGPGNSIFGRRHSAVSDSGDTGIGTYCSDSVEDDSCSSTTPSSLRLLSRRHSSQEDGFGSGVPVVHVKPSASTSSCGSLRTTSSPTCTGRWANSCPLSPPTTSPLAAQTGVDMQDKQPIRRWSSLTKLSSGVEKNSRKASVQHHSPGSHGSLDRGLLSGFRKEPRALNRDLYLPLSSSLLSHSLLQRSPGAGPCYWSKPSSKSGLETDLSLSKLADSPLGHPVDRDSPIQPAVRTQMWLTEQMEYSSKAEHAGELGQGGGGEAKVCGGEGASLEQGINQVKVKEGMLRQKELEIDRQKQQILQLHARIRENELRAQQVLHSQRWFEDPQILTMKVILPKSPEILCGWNLETKLAVSELEVLHLNELYKQATHKYTEDLRKLEEKIKTRDRYISSLKKKYQRESDQNHEKQQRIETLEKYLADLPTLGEVQVQALQVLSRLQKKLDDSCALLKEKDGTIETQARREDELIATVHRLQQKVQRCLEDGVRLDLKHLQVENSQLLERQDRILLTTKSFDPVTPQPCHRYPLNNPPLCPRPPAGSNTRAALNVLGVPRQVDDWLRERAGSNSEPPQAGRLLKELSLCLLDLQALRSILVQRAQGKELNLSLLLGMTSLNASAEESERRDEQEEVVLLKPLEVGQLRRGVDELRKNVAEWYVVIGCYGNCLTLC
uniref:Centrosomal protein 85, like n=1 Tax=Hippocampus comes TaxID=109280 RepID=A0A3Q2XK04_HIPCM